MTQTAPPHGLIRRTFVDPLRNWRRTLIYAGIFLGVLGFGLLNMISAYNYADGGTPALLGYFAGLYIPLCCLFTPALYAGFTTRDSRLWRVAIVALQMAALALFFQMPPHPILQGFAGACMAAPFWTCYHIGMVQNTSDDNTGFEVSLAGVFATCGGVLALAIGGLALYKSHPQLAVAIALTAQLAGTACLIAASRIRRDGSLQKLVETVARINRENRFLIRQVVLLGLFDMPGYAMLALMHDVRFAPALATLLLASRTIVSFLLAPIIGRAANSLSVHGVRYGFVSVALGWGLLTATGYSSYAFIPALIVYGFGQRLVGGVVDVSWYRMRSYASMILHEVYLGLGRVLGMIVFIPLLSLNVYAYGGAIIATALLALLLNNYWAQRPILAD